MSSLGRIGLSVFLAAWTAAAAAMPPCADEAGGHGTAASLVDDGDAQGETHDDAGGCDLGCALCACCRPLATPGSATSFAPALAQGRLSPGALVARGTAVTVEIFQPPRA